MDNNLPNSNAGEPPPIDARDYDFRPERVDTMDLATVETELSNVFSGKQHPYTDHRDGRHQAAQQYVGKLFERKQALTPEHDEGADEIARLAAARRQQAIALHRQCRAAGDPRLSDNVGEDLGGDVDPLHLQILEQRRDFYQGHLQRVIPELLRLVDQLGEKEAPAIREEIRALEADLPAFLTEAHPVTHASELDLQPVRKKLFLRRAAVIMEYAHGRALQRWNAIKQKVAAETAERRQREAELQRGARPPEARPL